MMIPVCEVPSVRRPWPHGGRHRFQWWPHAGCRVQYRYHCLELLHGYHTGKIFHDRSHAVTLLKTDMADAADKSRTVGKWRNSSHGQSLVGKAAHIDIDAVESALCRTGQADTFRCILSTAAHFREGAKQCHISLQESK